MSLYADLQQHAHDANVQRHERWAKQFEMELPIEIGNITDMLKGAMESGEGYIDYMITPSYESEFRTLSQAIRADFLRRKFIAFRDALVREGFPYDGISHVHEIGNSWLRVLVPEPLSVTGPSIVEEQDF